jgi:hypothetical protein
LSDDEPRRVADTCGFQASADGGEYVTLNIRDAHWYSLDVATARRLAAELVAAADAIDGSNLKAALTGSTRPETVHMLMHGRALCGLAGEPRDWPAGNKWTWRSEANDATCATCIAEHKRLQAWSGP